MVVSGSEPPWDYEHEWRYIRKSSLPRLRLLSQVLHDNYNRIHSDSSFVNADFVEWSEITERVLKPYEEEINN
jgi:hypothetical protein